MDGGPLLFAVIGLSGRTLNYGAAEAGRTATKAQ